MIRKSDYWLILRNPVGIRLISLMQMEESIRQASIREKSRNLLEKRKIVFIFTNVKHGARSAVETMQ